MLQLITGHRTWIGLTCLVTAVACGPSSPPAIDGLTDQVAQVGSELVITLAGTDPEGDLLTYGFAAPDLPDIASEADVTQSPSGLGVFRWTPLGSDVGQHAFDFTVSDGSFTTTATIQIDVRSAVGPATTPVFREPVGTGATIDLARTQCVKLDIVIDDADTADVRISQGDPVIEGADLAIRDGHTATWQWCPSRGQQAEPRYTLKLVADDGDNPKTTKDYLIVLRGGGGSTCPGTPPVIEHAPGDVSSILDLTISATISDDVGIKEAPLLYVSDTAPADPPDLARMTQVTTHAVSGDARRGVYAGEVHNPVAQLPAGMARTLYYVFVADDDDDSTGSCDHATVSPVYSMTVTSTGTADLPICVACTSDAQCGAGDECVRMGAANATFCLEACDGGCPTGYSCSGTKLTSVDGAQAFQCVPDSGSCELPTGPCADDSFEVNDTRTQASGNPALALDTYDLVSCPSTTSQTRANEDWFKIVVASDQRVDLQLAGGPATDLDLHVFRADGTLVTESTSVAPDEQINTCLGAATYFVQVNGFRHARNEYLLAYDSHAESCAVTCSDDSHEDDDTYSQARDVLGVDFESTGNAICANDDDWFRVLLFSGEVMTVDLTFTQSNARQDLDLHLYRDSIDLTPCDTSRPGDCTVEHGQGARSNEHTVFTAPADCDDGCDYDVVVRGYDHAANTYGIAIGID